jgi:hypothetical protein
MQVNRRIASSAATIAALAAVVTVLIAWDRQGTDPPTQSDKDPVAATLLQSPSGTATAKPRPTPTDDGRLLPNLMSLPAEDISLELVDGQRRLRFASIIANTGIGPVETLPDGREPCPPDQRHASQVLYNDVNGNGRYEREVDVEKSTRVAGCMLFHATHDHWHFDAAASYTLTTPISKTTIAASEKVSFCWRDSRQVPGSADSRPTEFYGDCTRDTVQGITPGWADVYRATLPDQHLDLPPDLADGVYCLWNEADPLKLLDETNDADNAAARPIRIAGNTVTLAPGASCAP